MNWKNSMKLKTLKEIKSLSKEELGQEAKSLREGLARARFQRSSGQLADRALIWRGRKALSRVLYVLGQMGG
jgi:ribosomal protein L29